MTTLAEAATELRDALRLTGVRAVLEPDHINPPCVFLKIKHLEDRHLAAGVMTVEWYLYLCAPVGKLIDAYRHFDDLRAVILPAGFRTNGLGEAVELELPGGGKPVPALQCTIRTKID